MFRFYFRRDFLRDWKAHTGVFFVREPGVGYSLYVHAFGFTLYGADVFRA